MTYNHFRDLKRDCDCSNGFPDAKEVVTSIFSSFMELLLLLLCLLPLVFGTKALWTVLVVIACALVLRETLQMFASLKRYQLVLFYLNNHFDRSGTCSVLKTGWNFSSFPFSPSFFSLQTIHRTALARFTHWK